MQNLQHSGQPKESFPGPTEVTSYTFQPRRAKLGVILMGSVTLSYIGQDIAMSPGTTPDTVMVGMTVCIVFAVWAFVQLWQLVPGRLLLTFDEKGLTYRGPINETFWPWEDMWRPSTAEQSLVTVSKEFWVVFPLKSRHETEPNWMITHRNADARVPASTFVKKEVGARAMTKMVEAWRAHYAGPIEDPE